MEIRTQLKLAIINELNLSDITPDDIIDNEPLFGDGLGLDSLDAIELVVMVKRVFNVEIDDNEEGQQAFATFNSLLEYIQKHS